MKRILYIMPFILLAAVSCKEDTLDVYHGANYVHFTPGLKDTPEVSYNFALDGKTTREKTARIPVELRIWGYLPEADFDCMFSADTELSTAKSGDYSVPAKSAFRKGYHVDTLWIEVNRREKLLSTNYKVVVNLDGAEGGFETNPAKYRKVTLNITDELPAMPMWWGTTQNLGEYSAIKYRVFNIYLGKVLTDLNEYTNITFKEETVAFKAWWKENWAEYEYYDKDGVTPLYDTIPD
jgi:hypothetical protein